MLAFGSRQKNSLEFLLQLYSSLAQSVEHSAVNRVVVGSSPTGGVRTPEKVLTYKAPWSSGQDIALSRR